jgi:hypothetical protein
VPRLRVVELHHHSTTRLHDVVLKQAQIFYFTWFIIVLTGSYVVTLQSISNINWELSISSTKAKECSLYVRRIRAAGNVARMEAMRNSSKILVGVLNIPLIFVGIREFGNQFENWFF